MVDYTDKWRRERERKAFIALADGAIFHGVAFGALKDGPGEVVFNTGMSGYQEILTDPSYAGQFVTLTTAEVGNYGINPEDVESRGLFLNGLVIGEYNEPSNYRSTMSLDEYLKQNGVPGIYGVDTRALTIHLREHGNQKAWLCVEDCGNRKERKDRIEVEREAVEKAKAWEGLDGQDYASRVSCREPYEYIDRLTDLPNDRLNCDNASLPDCIDPMNHCSNTIDQSANESIQSVNRSIGQSVNSQSVNRSIGQSPHVICYDFGVKTNILRSLAQFARVTVVPAKTPAEEVIAMNPDGVFLSNGPADPAAVTYAIDNIRKLLDYNRSIGQSVNRSIPLMGICLGHQLLSIACGAKTGRLKFGHHGCNHPVKNLATGEVEITSQNHNFAVLEESVPDCLEVTHLNLNDGSIEGVRHKTLPAFSVQYHPESCPGPHDSDYLFEEFKKMITL